MQLGYPLGIVGSTGVFAMASRLPEAAFLAWGWRVPFLLSAILVGIGLFIRLRFAETPVFREVLDQRNTSRMPSLEILAKHRRTFLIAVGLKVTEIAYVTIATIYSITYATTRLGLPRSVIFNGILLAAVIQLFTIPTFGWLSDRYGRKPLFFAGCAFAIAFAFPMFWLFDTKDPTIIAMTVAIAVTFGQGIMFGPAASWISELFSTRLRYSGASLGFQLGAVIGGGLTPLIAAALLAWSGGSAWPVSIYLILLGLVTLAATIAAPETAGKPLS